jgi:hypothetical protein
MKLKAPEGVGDPSVAGVVIESRNGVYEVDANVGVLLIECFRFAEVSAGEKTAVVPPPDPAPRLAPLGRRGLRLAKDPD